MRRLVLDTPTLLGLGGISARLRELAAAGFDTADIKALVLRSPLVLGSNISRHVDSLLDAGFALKGNVLSTSTLSFVLCLYYILVLITTHNSAL